MKRGRNRGTWKSIPEIAAASTREHERIVVLQLYTYRVDDKNVGRIDAGQIYNIFDPTTDPKSCKAIDVAGKDPVDGPVQITAINGHINPTFKIARARSSAGGSSTPAGTYSGNSSGWTTPINRLRTSSSARLPSTAWRPA